MITPPGYGSPGLSSWAAAMTAAANSRYAGTYATAGNRDLDITGPTEGMLAYLTTPDHLTIYQSGGWKVLAGAGTYTPTLGAGIVIGTGGSAGNAANWSYAGGVLQVEGLVTLGTSGQSIGATAHTLSLPVGFTAARATQFRPVGNCRLTPAGGGYIGEVVIQSATTILIAIGQIASGFPTLQSITSLVPATWAAGNQILWSATIAGVMT